MTRGEPNTTKSVLTFDNVQELPSPKRRKTSHVEQDETKDHVLPASSPPAPVQTKQRPDFVIHIDDDPLYPKPIRRAKQQHVYPRAEHLTGNFWSGPDDCFRTRQPNGQRVLPFCIAACNTNSLIAMGDELGAVKILDSAAGSREGFSNAYLSINAHNNAVMDLTFSSDDRLLCSGGGDQTARIIDMRSQKTILILNEHRSSLRQVLFQPGNDNIVGTSSRDGTVLIWDLRCETRNPTRVISGYDTAWRDYDRTLPQGKSIHSIKTVLSPAAAAANARRAVPTTPSNRNLPSITSMTFLNTSQPNLLLTASDDTSKLALWDLRFRARSRSATSGASIPVSTSAPIPSHARHRDWGITSLTLSSDFARCYAMCRDNTIYTYSTAHIALGAASSVFANPDQSISHRARPAPSEGALPLYALTNPALHVSTFFVRGAIRRPGPDAPELLATGTGDPTPLLFPTDERLLRTTPRASAGYHAPTPTPTPAPQLATPPASSPASAPSKSLSRAVLANAQAANPFPTYVAGTALMGAHSGDVTAVAWSADGALCSIADDCTARVWREGAGVVRGREGSSFERRPAAAVRAEKRVQHDVDWEYGSADGRGFAAFDQDES